MLNRSISLSVCSGNNFSHFRKNNIQLLFTFFLNIKFYTGAPLSSAFRWLWRPVLRDRRDRQLEWWRPGPAVILTQTSVSLCERKHNITWKLPLLCIFPFRHKPEEEEKNCYIILFTFCVLHMNFCTLIWRMSLGEVVCMRDVLFYLQLRVCH